jgi:hypothetical protein
MSPDSERPGGPGPESASHSGPADRMSPTRVLVATAVGVTLVWLAIVVVWGDAPFALTFDDAFYYFGIARNVAHGHGSTFDGVDPTNGYHPLWMLMAVPVFALGLDGTTAVRALLAAQVLFLGAALVTLAVVAGRAIDDWQRLRSARGGDGPRAAAWCTVTVALTLAVAGGNPFIVKVFANGLESGVLVLLDALILTVGAAWRSRWLTRGSGGARLAVGVLLALTILARTDSLLLVAGLGLWTLAEARTLGRRAVRPMLELFVLPAVTTAAYLISNQVQFGIWLQISGIVKRQDITPARAAIMVVVVALALAIGRQGFRRLRAPRGGPRFRRVSRFAASTAWFAGFAIVLVAYYQVLQSQQWLWYYCPVVLYALFLLVLGVADFVESAVVEAPPSGSLARALAPIEAILLVPLVVAFVLQARTFADPHLRSILVANRDAGQWIDENLPPDAVLASWDAGVVGFYARRPVINLDGVANSREYYDAGRNGTIGAFLAARGLTGIVNHGMPVDGQDPDIRSFIRSTFGEQVERSSRVVQLFPFVYNGTTTSNDGAESGTRPLAVFVYELPAGGPSI